MSASLTRHLWILGCNHRAATLQVRERIALQTEQIHALYGSLQASGKVSEAVILNTCNRVEIYAVSSDPQADEQALRQLAEVTGFAPAELRSLTYLHTEIEALEHLFDVAAGLDSQMLGENEIFGQVKDAYARAAQKHTAVGPILHRVFQKSFQAGKWARTRTGIATGQTSLGNVAVELSQRIFTDLRAIHLLVVGSGEVGRDVAKAFHSRGVHQVSVSSRNLGRAESLATEVEGTAVPFDQWLPLLTGADLAIFCTASPGSLLEVEDLNVLFPHGRKDRPLFLLDLAVPRDVDALCGESDNVFLYNLDDLAAVANENKRLREAEVEHCRRGLRERAQRVWRSLRPMLVG